MVLEWSAGKFNEDLFSQKMNHTNAFLFSKYKRLE